MMFNEKLKKAMQDLGNSQSQVVGMTRIGKSSISQYLSSKSTHQKTIGYTSSMQDDLQKLK